MRGWSTHTLGDLASDEPNSLVDGPFGSDLKTSDYAPTGVPLIRIQNVRPDRFLAKDTRYVSLDKARRLSRHDYRPGDLVITKLGDPCGVACVVPPEAGTGLIVADIVRFRGDPRIVDHGFLSRFINSPAAMEWVDREAKGSTRQRVNLSNFKRLPVPVPPLREQRRIAEVLDRADALRAKRRAALAQLNALAQSIFLDMFGDPGASGPHQLPETLGMHLVFVTSGSRGWAEYYAPTGSRFIRSLDVQMNRFGSEDVVFVVPPENAEARRTQVRTGDVLLTITGSRIGRVAAVPEELSGSYVSQHVAILRVNPDRLEPRFLAEFLSLRTGGQRQIASAQYGQTKPGLNFDQIRRFQVPVPSRGLQRDYVRRVGVVETLRSTHRASLTQLDSLFVSLQQHAFSGQL